MKNIYGKAVIVLLIAMATLCACKKNKDGDTPVTVENLVGTYKLVKITFKASGTNTETEATDYIMDECEQDDKATLFADKTYTNLDDGTVCSPENNATGTWDLPGNNKFQLTLDTEVEVFDIVSFNGTTLVLSYPINESGFNGTAYVYQQKQ